MPWTAIMEYADRAQLDAEVTSLFLEVMRGMDAAWLQWQNEQRKRR